MKMIGGGGGGAGSGSGNGPALPHSWQEGLGLLSDVMRGAIEAQDKRHLEEMRGVIAQLDDVRSLVAALERRLTENGEQFGRGIEEASAAAGAAATAVAALETRVTARADELATSIAAATETAGRLAGICGELNTAVAATAAQLEKIVDASAAAGVLAQQAVTASAGWRDGLAGLTETLETVETRVAAVDLATNERFTALEATVEDIGNSIGATDAAVTSSLTEIGAEVREDSNRITEMGRQVAELVANVDAVLETAGEATAALEASRQALADVRSAASALPVNWQINRAGELTRVNGRGEVVSLGTVCGRDGTDAASVAGVAVQGSDLVLTYTDRSSIRCTLPAPAPSTVSAGPTAPALSEEEQLIADVLHARDVDQLKFQAIAEKYGIKDPNGGISARKAARIYKGACDHGRKGR